jgi:hypothetical protein
MLKCYSIKVNVKYIIVFFVSDLLLLQDRSRVFICMLFETRMCAMHVSLLRRNALLSGPYHF